MINKFILINCVLAISISSTTIAKDINSETEVPTKLGQYSFEFDYGQFLTKEGKRKVAVKITRTRIAEKIKNGTYLEDNELSERSDKVILPVSFTKDTNSYNEESDNFNTSSVVTGWGDIECWDLVAHDPHVGEEHPSLPYVPKAKAEGKCRYIHISGIEPSWVQFELRQILIQEPLRDEDVHREDVEFHVKSAVTPTFQVQWYANSSGYTGTQVFGNCPTFGDRAIYTHDFQIEVYAPPGWTYNGPRPFTTAPNIKTRILSC